MTMKMMTTTWLSFPAAVGSADTAVAVVVIVAAVVAVALETVASYLDSLLSRWPIRQLACHR